MGLDKTIADAVIYYPGARVPPLDLDGGSRASRSKFEAGVARYAARDFAGAERAFEAAAALRPGWLWPRLLAADSAYFHSRFVDAEKEFVAVAKAFPNNAWAHALLGRARYLQGLPSMLGDLDRAIALEPDAGWIYAWRAAAKGLLKDRAGAERDYKTAVRLAPDYERARSWFGAFLAAGGRPVEAVRELEAARRIDPDSEVTAYALARTCLQLRRPGEAKLAFAAAIRINRTAAWERGWSDVLHADRACEATLKETAALLARFPGWTEGWAWKGQTELRLKKYDEALASFARAGSGVWTRVWRGETLRRLGDWRRAESEFDAAIRADKNCAWAWAGRGATRLALGSYAGAASDLDKAIAIEPRCGKGLAYLWRGEAFLRLGKDSGRKDLRAALDFHPNFAQARRWLGDAPSGRAQGQGAGARLEKDAAGWTRAALERLNAGDAAGAVADASRAVEDGMDPTYLPGYEVRSAAREALGELELALDDCLRVLAMDPGHPRAGLAARRLALDSVFAGPGLPRSLWRGILVHGVMQNRQGTTDRLDQVAAIGDEFTARFGWRDATGPKTAAYAPALARLSPAWASAARVLGASDVRSASRFLDSAVALDPSDMSLRVLRAYFRFEVQNPYLLPSDAAWADLRLALEKDPDNAWAHAAAGLGFFFQQYLSQAIAHFTRLTALKPGWAWAHVLRGVPRWYFSETEGSIDDFARAVGLDHELPWAHLLVGRSKADHRSSSGYQGDTGDADLDRAAELEPSGVVLGWRGCAFMGKKDFKRARRDFDAAIRAWPAYDRVYAWRGMLSLMAGKPKAALPDLRHSVGLNPNYPTAQYTLGRAYLELGRWKEALAAQREGASRDSRYLWDWCWFDVSHPNPAARKSIEDLGVLLEKDPKAAWGWAWRGQSRMLLRDYTGALEDIDRALALDPRDPWARLWKGEALRRVGRWREAIASLDAALKLDPKMHWALTSRGGCRLQLGEYKAARKDLDRALALNPRSGRGLAHAWRGEALWRLRSDKAALKDFKTALEFYPNWFWLKKWVERLNGDSSPSPALRATSPRSAGRGKSDAWVEKHPFDIGGLVARAESRYKKGDYAGSIEDASRVLEMNMDPTHAAAACLRALARCDLGDVAGAKDELGRVEVLEGEPMTDVTVELLEAARGADLTGKVVVLTGASGRIGRPLALLLARRGASLALCARRLAPLRALARELKIPRERLYVASCDVGSEAACARFVAAAAKRLGPVDILINNAGIRGPEALLSASSPSDWRRVLATNLDGSFHMARAVLRSGMLARKRGVILNVSSGAGRRPKKGWGAYGVSKSGLEGFTQALALELAGTRIRVNAFDPCTLRGKRATLPEEMAAVFLFLAGDVSRGFSGRSYALNEGGARRGFSVVLYPGGLS